MAANMQKNSLKNVESDNNNFFYETSLNFFLQRNGTYCLNKPRSFRGGEDLRINFRRKIGYLNLT